MVEYKVIENDDDEYYELDTNRFSKWDAEDAARDYFEGYNGREEEWPLTFALYSEEGGKEVCRYKVELKIEPVFSATSIK